jgi:Na+(H+)/acetate symporter ActP
MWVNYVLSIRELLFLALNRFSLVAIACFFHTLLLGLWGLLAGKRGLVFGPWSAQIFTPSMGHAQGIKTPLSIHKFHSQS